MQTIRTGSKRLIREINQALVLHTVRSGGAVSRTDVARQTGLGLPTVSGIAGELVESGLLLERDAVVPGVGRPPVLLSLNAAAGYAVGIKLLERRLVAVLTDLEATVVHRHEARLAGRSVDVAIDAIVAAVGALAPAAEGRPIHGVGIGLAGVIDRSLGVVRHATYSSWRSVPLAGLLEARLGMAVVLDNDVNALVAAEQWFGAGRDKADFVTVSIGRGVGLGMVLDGRLYRGATGGAGELGHVKVELGAGGRRCACGATGCLETIVSEPAIAATVGARKGRRVSIERALALAADGDDDALDAYRHAGTVLGTAIGNLLNVLNSKAVVVAGEGTRGYRFLERSLIAALSAATFDGIADDVELHVEPWDDEAWARGSASLLLGELFEPALRPGDDRRPRLTP